MNWINVSDGLPKPAERVLAMNGGVWVPARHVQGRVIVGGANEPMRWIDDQSLPLRQVTAWARVVSSDETA